jgi:hypothetical protein
MKLQMSVKTMLAMLRSMISTSDSDGWRGSETMYRFEITSLGETSEGEEVFKVELTEPYLMFVGEDEARV